MSDWAVVIEGWEASWLWRVLMTVAGTLLYVVFVRLAFLELGRETGGYGDEQFLVAKKICTLCYTASFVVVLIAGLFCPYGLLGLPVLAGLTAVLGALSPLMWVTRWFHTKYLAKSTREPLEIHRKWQWLVASVIVVFLYTFILGRTLYFNGPLSMKERGLEK